MNISPVAPRWSGEGSGDPAVSPVLHLIGGRRSVYRFAAEPIDEEDLRFALDMAVLAPNHRMTRPWRFAVFIGEARNRLASAFAAAAQTMQLDPERARLKPLIAPAVVCVGVSPQLARPKVDELEELFAVAAAIQNMMLALHGRGLGSLWTTGAICESPKLREFLGWTGQRDRVLGIVHVGRTAPTERHVPRNIDHRTYTDWHR